MIQISENQGEGTEPAATGPCGGPESSVWSLETLGKVTDGVAHDFNNILATISGFAELILDTDQRRDGNPRDVSSFAKHILQAAITGQSTVRQLRGFTRRSEEKETLDLHDVLQQSMTMARGALGGGISITSAFLPRPFFITGCRGLLHNVFINLFFNARDAMAKGGDIAVRTDLFLTGVPPVKGLPDFVVVSVKDTGVGMTEDLLERIFEPLFTTKGTQGSGMGLANVNATIKAHGGWITTNSALGQGSEFRIHLPLNGNGNGDKEKEA